MSLPRSGIKSVNESVVVDGNNALGSSCGQDLLPLQGRGGAFRLPRLGLLHTLPQTLVIERLVRLGVPRKVRRKP